MSNKPITTESLEEVMDRPERYGLPTFDEYRKNEEKYIGRDDDSFREVDRGSDNLRRVVQRHIYEIEGYRCKTLEEVEKVALNQGIPLRELDYRPEMVQAGAGKYDIIVRFVSKNKRENRKLWG